MESMNRSSNQELLTREQTEIIQELVNCALACDACSAACLNENEIALMTRCVELTRDCADSCFQAARLIMRKSEIADQYLTICEEACKLCAEECKKHNLDHCELCAEACENCSESCNAYYHGETKE